MLSDTAGCFDGNRRVHVLVHLLFNEAGTYRLSALPPPTGVEWSSIVTVLLVFFLQNKTKQKIICPGEHAGAPLHKVFHPSPPFKIRNYKHLFSPPSSVSLLGCFRMSPRIHYLVSPHM